MTSCLFCLTRCDGNIDHPQCSKSPAPKIPNIGVFYIPTSPMLAPVAAGSSLSWQRLEKCLHLLPFRWLLPHPGVPPAVLSSDAQQWCLHCTPTDGGEEGSQICPWYGRSSVGQLYHFPEVRTGLLLLLGRIQSVRCDKPRTFLVLATSPSWV